MALQCDRRRLLYFGCTYKAINSKITKPFPQNSHELTDLWVRSLLVDLKYSILMGASLLTRAQKFVNYYFLGVGKKVKVLELMDIASANKDDNHVIQVRKYETLQEAVQKAVQIKVGELNFK